MSYDLKIIEEKLKQAPSEVRDAILSVDVLNKIESIGEKHKLQIDTIGDLAEEVGAVMLGITKPQDFLQKIKDNIDKEKAEKIVLDVNNEIFALIRESLKKVHNIEESSREERSTPRVEIAPKETLPNAFDQKMKGGSVSEEKESFAEQKLPPRPTVTNDPYREPIA